MPVHNNDIAKVFEEIADLLELEDANPFRVRAYRNAARTLRGLGTEVSQMIKEGRDLTDLPGIGDDLAGKITEVAKTGSLALLKKLRREFPPALTEMLQIPGLGPKRVQTLYHELDIHTLPQLRRAAKDGRIRSLPGLRSQDREAHSRSGDGAGQERRSGSSSRPPRSMPKAWSPICRKSRASTK